jgi:MFS family permease
MLDFARSWLAPISQNVTDRNARYLEIEIFWAAFLSAAAAFNAPFALRLGATNTEIGLLSSAPALIALLVTIPAGQFFGRQVRRMPWLIWSIYLHRLGYLLIVFIPWLPLAYKGTILIWLLIIFSTPAHFFGVGWSAMLADVIPEADRARVFAMRNILAALAITAGIFVAGRWLERVVFPVNYQVMFAVGFIASILSLIYILKLQVPDSAVLAAPRQPVNLSALWRGARQAIAGNPDFVRIVVNTLAHGIGLWMIGPLYVLYYMRTLGATEGWFGLNGTLGNLTPIIGFYFWQRGIARWGENRVLKWTITVVGLYPVLVSLAPGLTAILLLTALNGLLTPGVSLSHFPMLLKICPAAERPVYLGIHATIMNAGAFVMPLVGVRLADRFGIAPILIAGGILCLAGSSLFRFWPLQTPDSLAARQMR